MKGFFEPLALYSLAIAGAILLGGVLPLFRHWHAQRLPIILSLAAGIMLGSAFFHLIPEAYEMLGAQVGFYILLGFLFLYSFEKFVTVHICEALDCEVHHLGISASIGIAIHTLTNGVALGSGLLLPGLGFVVFLAVSAHKAPEAFSLTSVLLHSGTRRSKIILVHFLNLLMIPLGAILAFFFIRGENSLWIGRAIAFSAGTFLHISLSDLLPEVHKHSHFKTYNYLAFVAGLAVMWLLENHLPKI